VHECATLAALAALLMLAPAATADSNDDAYLNAMAADNIHSVGGPTQARVVISDWKYDYNHCESSGGWSGTGWQG
jgi:hypothetical protein